MTATVVKRPSAAGSLHRLADSYVARFARAMAASFDLLRDRVTNAVVARDLARGLAEPVGLFRLIDGGDPGKEPEMIYRKLLTGGAEVAGVLDLRSPFVEHAAQRLTAGLVTGVNTETKKAIRQLIYEAVRDGDPPDVAQLAIRRIVGLTKRDAIAVKRLAENATETQAERYAAKLLRRRAINIARTETMRASNVGQQLAWREMAADRLIDTSRFQQRWLVTDDDRLCEFCAPMDGMLAPLDSVFVSSQRGVLPSERETYAGETVESPPLHPACRCTLVADFGEE